MAIWYMQNDVPFERTSLDLYESSIIQMTYDQYLHNDKDNKLLDFVAVIIF